MSEDVVHVGLNEGRAQWFKPYNNGEQTEHTYPVPHAVWDAYAEAKAAMKAAKAVQTAALQALLDAMKAGPRPGDVTRALRSDDDFIVECVVDGDRIYWP